MTDTDAATIAALLEELKEVDPLLWDKITYLDQGDRVIKFAYQVLDNFALDHLQCCIQRAIAAKGGDWLVESWNSPKGLFHRAEIIGWKGGEYKQDAYTSAAAILAAYIEAVMASK